MYCLEPKVIRGVLRPCGNKCWRCLSGKRWRYSARILAEMANHERSWFVTLTLRKSMTDAVGYRLVQRWLKRLRKRTGLAIRYACVAEHGGQSTKRLHYHVVLHGPSSLVQRSIRSTWKGGISHATLVDGGSAQSAAQYSSKVARYVQKGSGRFRFSTGYGSLAWQSLRKRTAVDEVLTYFPGARVSLHGVNVPRKLFGPIQFRSVFDPELVADAERERALMRAAERVAEGERASPPFTKTKLHRRL